MDILAKIDWLEVLVAGVVSGGVGLLLALARALYGRLAPRLGPALAASLCLAAVALAGGAVAYSPLGSLIRGYYEEQRVEDRFERAAAEHMKPLLESPAFRKRLEGLDSERAHALAARLSAQGLLRLPDERLVKRAHLLDEALAGAGEATCAALFLGTTPVQNRRLLSGLPDESLGEWLRLSAEASLASLREAPPRRRLEPPEVRDAVRHLYASLPEAEAKRLAAALRDPASLEPPEACWAARTIYGTFAELPKGQQALVARVLAMQ